jgi:hypothetical protein
VRASCYFLLFALVWGSCAPVRSEVVVQNRTDSPVVVRWSTLRGKAADGEAGTTALFVPAGEERRTSWDLGAPEIFSRQIEARDVEGTLVECRTYTLSDRRGGAWYIEVGADRRTCS